MQPPVKQSHISPPNNRSVTIREAGITDALAIVELEQQLFESAWNIDALEQIIATHTKLIGIAVEISGSPDTAPIHAPDNLLGFVVASLAADELEVLSIGVASNRQGSGLGRQLLAWLEAMARPALVTRAFLEVNVNNVPARALYEATGFIEVGTRPNYYHHTDGSTSDALVLSKSLNL